MAIEASNLTKKDELISKFYTVRAGLSVIAEETEKIRKAEEEYNSILERNRFHNQAEQSSYNIEYDYYVETAKKCSIDIDSFYESNAEQINDLETSLSEKQNALNKAYVKLDEQKEKRAGIFSKTAYRNRKRMDQYTKGVILGILFAGGFFGTVLIALFASDTIMVDIWLIIHLLIIGISVIGIFLYGLITGKKLKKRELVKIDVEIEGTNKDIFDLKQEIEALNREIMNKMHRTYNVTERAGILCEPQRKDYDFDHYIDEVNAADIRLNRYVIPSSTATVKSVRDALTDFTEGLLIEEDWKNVDLLIFYLKTGRADSLQEALLLVDKQRQTDQISEAISSAAVFVANSINKSVSQMTRQFTQAITDSAMQLEKNINDNNTKLAGMITSTITRSIDDNGMYMRSAIVHMGSSVSSQIREMNHSLSMQNAAMLNEQRLNSSLLSEANTRSDQLMDELRYNQRFWVK